MTKTGERQYDVGFEDLLNGGDRDYDDNPFRFTGGLAPNRSPVADDQALSTLQGHALPITLTATDPDDDPLTFALTDAPRHGIVTGSGSSVTYTPAADFSGVDTFAFTAGDGESTPDEGRITIEVTPPTNTGGSGRPTPSDCPGGELTLVNVQRIGARVRVTGLAERTLAGAPVIIVEGGVVVARATIRPDGGFKVGVALPAKRGGRTLRYQAQLGVLRSRNLRLRRRMITTAARLQRGRIVFSGRVVNSRRLRKGIVVRLDARPRGCGTRYVRIGQARLRRDGRFVIKVAALKGVDLAVYRASASLRRNARTFSRRRSPGAEAQRHRSRAAGCSPALAARRARVVSRHVRIRLLTGPPMPTSDGNGFRPDFLDAERRLDDDRRRDQLLTFAGWRVIRVKWRQVVYEPEHVAATLRALFES